MREEKAGHGRGQVTEPPTSNVPIRSVLCVGEMEEKLTRAQRRDGRRKGWMGGRDNKKALSLGRER